LPIPSDKILLSTKRHIEGNRGGNKMGEGKTEREKIKMKLDTGRHEYKSG